LERKGEFRKKKKELPRPGRCESRISSGKNMRLREGRGVGKTGVLQDRRGGQN